MWWRIYDLGYSPERFDAVDSMLIDNGNTATLHLTPVTRG